MKTNRDIVSGLDIARSKKTICRTIYIEEAINKQQLADSGELLSPSERDEVIRKELKRMRAQDQAMKKSQRKILRQKARSSLIQQTRNEASSNKGKAKVTSSAAIPPVVGKAKERMYREIVIKY